MNINSKKLFYIFMLIIFLLTAIAGLGYFVVKLKYVGKPCGAPVRGFNRCPYWGFGVGLACKPPDNPNEKGTCEWPWYYKFSRKLNFKALPSPDPELISGWKIPTDNLVLIYDFQFLYPPDWKYSNGIDSPSLGVSDTEGNYLTLNIYRNDRGCKRQRDYTHRGRTSWKWLKEYETKINNYTATLIEGEAAWSGYREPELNREFYYKIILLPKDGLCYDLSWIADKGTSSDKRNVLDQILSTFRFTN